MRATEPADIAGADRLKVKDDPAADDVIANIERIDGDRALGIVFGYQHGWSGRRPFDVRLVPVSGGAFTIALNLSTWGLSTAVRIVLSQEAVRALRSASARQTRFAASPNRAVADASLKPHRV